MDFKAFKMDGLGNDFVIIDNRQKIINLTKDQIVKICDRNFIGCDQLIFIESDSSADASLRFFNSDGGESGACGNGTRCVADLISKEKNDKSIILNTLSGELKSKILDKKIVITEIGKARLKWNKIPLSKEMDTKNLEIKIIDRNNNEHIGGTAINVGNPHVVFFVKKIEDFDIETVGPDIENHELFPEKCNVTIAQVIDKNLIKVKVWERGAGLTKACGTAACATAYAGKLNNLTENKTDIEFSTGKLSILIDENNSIHMRGPVSDIKEINIKL
ncbi:diaminopimelate epimerase [Candidatus Pelagibacter communis]|uniref:diaminopimelate epimerase n=1 Tax=Pelagibacter ubique TaxID=198252 RepID=UPI00094D784E